MLVRTSPSEYVVRVGHDGKIIQVGQGLTFWAWPWEAHLRFPATLQWMLFSASQITRENQGVHIKGSFTWRVVDPETAYQHLNLERVTADEVIELMGRRSCEPERYAASHQSPLLRTTLLIRQLAESVTRNALANMSLEEALRDRRAILALLTEQLDAVVVPWGVAISAIEIVDVAIASSEVFENMQAEYREQVRQQARMAHIAAEEDITQREAAAATRAEQWQHDKAIASLTLQSEHGQRAVEVHEEVERRRIAVDAGLDMERTLAEGKRRQTELEAELGRKRQRGTLRREQRLASLEVMDRRQEIMGRVNDACRAQELIMRLPRLVSAMRPDKSTVFASSLPAASIEGLGAAIVSLTEAAGIKFAGLEQQS